jgi:hypothetical protein
VVSAQPHNESAIIIMFSLYNLCGFMLYLQTS